MNGNCKLERICLLLHGAKEHLANICFIVLWFNTVPLWCHFVFQVKIMNDDQYIIVHV